jgi:hypothetical protein
MNKILRKNMPLAQDLLLELRSDYEMLVNPKTFSLGQQSMSKFGQFEDPSLNDLAGSKDEAEARDRSYSDSKRFTS